MGASLGAAVALELALTKPALARSVSLVTPFAVAMPRLFAALAAWQRLAAEASPATLAHALAPLLFSDAPPSGAALASPAADALPSDGGYEKRWVVVRVGPVPVFAFPNGAGRRGRSRPARSAPASSGCCSGGGSGRRGSVSA